MTENNKQHAPVLPYLCEPSTILGLIILGELLSLVLLFAKNTSPLSFSWVDFGTTSLLAQWIILVSAGILCQTRPLLNRLSPVANGALAYGLCLLVAGITLWITHHFFLQQASASWIQGFLIAAIVSGVLLRYLWLQQQLRNREQAELNARFDALHARIQPHFLFNSMNTIASLVTINPQLAEKTIEDLSALFRASLSAPTLIPLHQELDLCQRYLAIEKARLADRLTIEWDVTSPLPDKNIPSLLLQPLLENAIVHGIQKSTQGGTIRFKLAVSQEVLTIYIANPLPDERLSKTLKLPRGNQMAHHNIKHRLATYYGSKAKMRVDRNNDQHAYEIILTLPLNTVS